MIDLKAMAAIRTLEMSGYTYHGGDLWKPPLGKRPAWLKGAVPLYKVRLDPGEGFTIEYPVLLTTKNQATACEARDRYWMWLHKEGLTRG